MKLKILFIILVIAFNVYPETKSTGYVTIAWDPVTTDIYGDPETGIIYYYIYCTENSYIEPDDTLIVGATTATTYRHYDARLDDPGVDLYFYVAAVDQFGNKSSQSTDHTLPVKLSLFSITEENNTLLLKWTTQSELDNLGFNIYKKTGQSGAWQKVNTVLIQGSANSTSELNYQFVDETVNPLEVYYYKLESVDVNGAVHSYESQSIYVTGGTPDKFALVQNYPNPFNPSTTITYALPENSRIKIEIFNVRGESVRLLQDNEQPAGVHSVIWNGQNDHGSQISSGLYFYKMTCPKFTKIKRMIFAK